MTGNDESGGKAELKPLQPNDVAPAIYHWWRVGEVEKAEKLIQRLVATARAEGRAEERKRFEKLVEAAKGLSYGVDWNNGTHAKTYRPKLLEALKPFLNGTTQQGGEKL